MSRYISPKKSNVSQIGIPGLSSSAHRNLSALVCAQIGLVTRAYPTAPQKISNKGKISNQLVV